MDLYPHIYKTVFLLLSTCLLSTEVTSTQEGASYFFFQQPEFPRDCKEALDQCSSDNLSGVYSIKPDGYIKPFEVYCDNHTGTGGWTVIQRRFDGSLSFERNWEDLKSGYGYLSSEFWIGNEKLSYLTNQAVYELRIDMVLSNGSSFYVSYSSFRIGDEWGLYAVVKAEGFTSNSSCVVSTCPDGMIHGNCTCQRSCKDPIGMIDCNDNCEETCLPEGCYVTETGSLISNGESYINNDCTQNCTCIDNHLDCNPYYVCSHDATCQVQNGVRRCYCNEGYHGNGEICESTATFQDCYDAYQAGNTADGIYSIRPSGWTGSAFDVFCDMTTDGGGWTVFQRRIDGVTSFYRYWNEYKEGFGSMAYGNDFWLGNEKIHYLTNQRDYILRAEIVKSGSDSTLYDIYSSFMIGDESTKYQLNYATYTHVSAPGDGFEYSNHKRFSTRDQDNDGCAKHDFAKRQKGGWWYRDEHCFACYGHYCDTFEFGSNGCYTFGTNSNLNGAYTGESGENIYWGGRTAVSSHCNLRSSLLKVRPSYA